MEVEDKITPSQNPEESGSDVEEVTKHYEIRLEDLKAKLKQVSELLITVWHEM